MPTFRSIIKAHLDLTRKLPELPAVIDQIWVDDCEAPRELANLMVSRLRQIQVDQGIGARIPQPTGSDLKVFVPMHMIVYVSTEIKAATGEVPTTDPDNPGEYVDNSGKRIRKQ